MSCRCISRWEQPLFQFSVPGALRSWLLESDSLTARCQASADLFRVRVLRASTGASLMAQHGQPQKRPQIQQREVLLECDGVPVIFAHTELPLAPRGRLTRWLAGLGSRSLGSLLFAYPGFKRGRIEVRRLNTHDVLYQRAIRAANLPGQPRLWARRSRHVLGRQSVIVTEVFLPAILKLR